MNIIEVSGLTKHYNDFLAVDHINFAVKEGEIFGFLGPNGAGKTTTIKMLTGLARPNEGSAIINNKDIIRQTVEAKKTIGVVTEDSNLYDELTVADNLEFTGQLYDVAGSERESRIKKLLSVLGLESKRDVKFAKLSKGMKRKVTIAAALVHSPSVLFLDEPTTGLDVLSARVLHMMIRELNQKGVTIFLTTHYIEEADRLCDTVAIIVGGKIKEIAAPEEFKLKTESKNLEEAFIEITGMKEEIMLAEKGIT